MNRIIKAFIVCLLFVTSVYAQDSQKITLDKIFKTNSFYPRTVYGLESMNDGLHYTTLKYGSDIEKFSYQSGKKVETVFSLSDITGLKIPGIDEYSFSKDESKLLLATDQESIYRHSTRSTYYVYDLKTKKLSLLSKGGKQQLACFSPDGSKVAFVRDNNIFIKDLTTDEEEAITSDGLRNQIINGAPDWVYEEEFSFSKGFEWSPDGEKIAFYRMDESKVKEYDLTIFDSDSLYPRHYTYKYPKAGEENSKVSIWVYNLKEKKTARMDIGSNDDQYIPRITWTKDPETLCILRLNRLQNKLDILLANAASGKSNIILSETNKRYIKEPDDNTVTFLGDQKHFIYLSEQDGYLHFYLYDLNGKKINEITRGNWDVAEFLAFDDVHNTLYYSSHETSPLQTDVYSINIDGKEKKKLSTSDGTNTAVFSSGCQYFIHTHSDANTPALTTLNNAQGKVIRTLEDNAVVKKNMKACGFSPKEFFSFKNSDGINLKGFMIKPNNFDSHRKYPVFMYVYGGPEEQTVKDTYNHNDAWFQMLAQDGIIVVCVDNRGSDGRGEEFRKCTYMQLGKLEVQDQIDAAKYLASQPYVDGSRIGIFGWSYGGYMSTLCMTKGADYFKMGIAVAPVTNWRYYDSVYTERFMRTPQENPSGYDDNSPINFVDKLKGKFLLVHGTGDDNVHLQNSMELIEKMVQANKQFEMQFYPNKNHGIYGGNTTYHLYTRLTDFILANL
ncbi:MAG: S9 family peptidase [Bacteroidota bacterium]|nr:S9 family peptidase [Bacteroidota bacterium]